MLFNTSYSNKEYVKESTDIVGKSFSLFEKLKVGDTKSGKLVINQLSPKLNLENTQSLVINYAYIELRPKGIIIHIGSSLDRYSWIIPYYRLIIYSTQKLSIHANGKFIQFNKNENYQGNKKFINKMIDIKNDFLNLGYYDT